MTKISELNKMIMINQVCNQDPMSESPYQLSTDAHKLNFNTYEPSSSPDTLLYEAKNRYFKKLNRSSSQLNNSRFVEIKDEDMDGKQLRATLLLARAKLNGKVPGNIVGYFETGRVETKQKEIQKNPSPLREEIDAESFMEQQKNHPPVLTEREKQILQLKQFSQSFQLNKNI